MTWPRCSAPRRKVKPATPTDIWNIWNSVATPQRGCPLVGPTSISRPPSLVKPTNTLTCTPGCPRSARDEGFEEIADWFDTLAKAERSHANRFQKALDRLTD